MRIITNIAKGKLLMLNLLKGKLGESIKIYFKILRIFLMFLIFWEYVLLYLFIRLSNI